jgi:hypothetical protein
MRAAPGETTEEIVAYYRRAMADVDVVIDELDLEATGDGATGRS